MNNADVLVILPTLGDRIDTLRETLESVQAQRADVLLTLAVVLPASATGARALAETYGAVIIDDPKQGISAAINRGLAARTSERFYAWVGDDDMFRPNGLATLKALLDHNHDAVLAYGGCDYIDPSGKVLALSNAGGLAKFLLPWGPDLIPHPGTMIRLDALEAIGRFDVSLKYAMDLDAFLKLRSHGRFVWTRTAVSAFRWHPDSLTVANRLESSRESERVKRNHLPRVLRPLSPVWNYPIRWASGFAASRINARA
jgi:glycosyltransferase involved in cell wall biosynthesis